MVEGFFVSFGRVYPVVSILISIKYHSNGSQT
jgi:hypothetical protein